jgi:hypothetical protein
VVGVGPDDKADARPEEDPLDLDQLAVAESLWAETMEMSATFAAVAWAASSPVGAQTACSTMLGIEDRMSQPNLRSG